MGGKGRQLIKQMRQTKLRTRFDIEARILLERRHLLAEQRLATRHEQKMIEHWDKANDCKLDVGKQEFYRQKGYDKRKLMQRNLVRAHRIEDIRLPKLKEALAAFNTEPLPFMDGDRSVVIN